MLTSWRFEKRFAGFVDFDGAGRRARIGSPDTTKANTLPAWRCFPDLPPGGYVTGAAERLLPGTFGNFTDITGRTVSSPVSLAAIGKLTEAAAPQGPHR
jgi:hypothetical protein